MIVLTGKRDIGQHIEILDLKNSRNELIVPYGFGEYYSNKRYGCVGGLLKGQPVICGGGSHTDVFQDYFTINEPNKKTNMLQKRCHASGVVLNQNKLWIVGGDGGSKWYENVSGNTSEFISLEKEPQEGPDLPFTISHHSMVIYNEKSIFIIGGLQNGIVSNHTWIINPSNEFQINEGPSLNIRRKDHCCGKILIDDGIMLVVVGGYDEHNNVLNSIELLDPLSDQSWKLGTDI